MRLEAPVDIVDCKKANLGIWDLRPWEQDCRSETDSSSKLFASQGFRWMVARSKIST